MGRELKLLDRIVINPEIFGGKPIIRGRRMAVEHVLGMLAAGDTPELLVQEYDWLERDDIRACLPFQEQEETITDIQLGLNDLAAARAKPLDQVSDEIRDNRA